MKNSHIMCNNLGLNIYIYFSDTTYPKLNIKTFKCIIYVNFVSASNNVFIIIKKLL